MKKRIRQYLIAIGLAAVFVLPTGQVDARPLSAKPPRVDNNNNVGPNLTPSPVTIDQIIHDHGNIVTTVDNFGYIGGSQFYGLPSGEWPLNSGHDYIGELKYWMGAITVDGDTLVADTDEDFQGIPSLISSVPEQKILLSTDTTRYYDYDLSDTTGLGRGSPAFGWKVWNADSSDWVYAQNYDPLVDTFFSGGPVSFQESHYRFNDAAEGSSLLGLELTHSVLQWNLCYNEDFLFVILEITNTSTTDYTDFAFGLYVDLDVGGPDGSGENGRLGDSVAFDSTANLAWTFDVDGYDPGWGQSVTTGYMGTKYLETPDNIGMTGFRTSDWGLVPTDDPDRYQFIDSSGFDTPLEPTDQYYIQCTRGIFLEAGKTVRVVYALVAGEDSTAFRNNADLAQQLYDNNFVGPQPPNTPTLTTTAGDRQVYLTWNDTAEVSIDPLSGENDFYAYKLYRSDNQGRTWGDVNEDFENNCMDLDYKTIAYYTVNTPGDPIQHSFIDTGLFNGVEYWYTLVAVDTGASSTGVDPLQTGFGVAGKAINVVAATPRNDPAGYFEAAGTVEHDYSGNGTPSDGNVIPIVFDLDLLQGANYSVVFDETPDQTFWHLINETSGDTVLADQTRMEGDPGLYDVVEGLRVVVRDGDRVPASMSQTELGGSEETLIANPGSFYGALTEFFFGVWFGNEHYRSTFELRYTGNSTNAPAFNDNLDQGMAWTVPFEVWNTSTDERVALVVYDFGLDGTWDPWDLLIIVNHPYDPVEDPFNTVWPTNFSWMFGFDDALYNPVVGDVFTIEGAPLNGPDDSFSFAADGINASSASAALADIRVVPNPYLVHNWSKIELSSDEPVLEFQNIPDECTIRIYTLSGDLVETIEHNEIGGAARWDLLSKDNQQVSSGVYLFHVESPYGEHLGRFAVIK